MVTILFQSTLTFVMQLLVTNFELFYSVANDQVWAAHLCYTLAGEKFGFPSDEKTKMALIGIDHR